jgi:APA family basic amino acid/polyamine antiporter
MTKLKKALSLYGLTMVAVGSCIGSGIFLTPSFIAGELPAAFNILLVWTVGGIWALTGALTFAELGGLFPKTGGVYVYLQEAYGDFVAYLYGWTILTVITSGAIAALALAFARYLDVMVPLGETGVQIAGIVAIVLVTLVNIFGVKMGEIFASFFTSLKLLGIAFIVLTGIWFYFSTDSLSVDFTPKDVPATSFAVALIGVMWSFGGWHHASYLAGETLNPQKTIPRAMFLGALIVTITYLLANLAYVFMLPIDAIATSSAVASDAIGNIFTWGGIFVAVLIAASTFGTAGIYTLSAPRIYFSMAKDGVFLKFLSEVHPRWQTPVWAISLQSAWSIVLLKFWSTFENLIAYVVFMDIVFMTLAGIGIFIFRKKYPTMERPYKVFAYPVIPFLFASISIWFLAYTLVGRPEQAIGGLVLVLLGSILYYLFFKKVENTERKE